MRGTHLTVLAERTRLPARTGRAVMAEVAADMVCVCVCGVSESEGVSVRVRGILQIGRILKKWEKDPKKAKSSGGEKEIRVRVQTCHTWRRHPRVKWTMTNVSSG
jgi:hypothetical protein